MCACVSRACGGRIVVDTAIVVTLPWRNDPRSPTRSNCHDSSRSSTGRRFLIILTRDPFAFSPDASQDFQRCLP